MNFKFISFILWICFFIFLLFNKDLALEFSIFSNSCWQVSILILFLLQLVFSITVLPVTPITLTAGLLWGFYSALFFSFISTLICTSFTYYLGAKFMSNQNGIIVSNHKVINILISKILKYRKLASFISHANPLLPGSSLGYLFGYLNVGFTNFIIGALLGGLPLQILMIIIGDNSKRYIF